MPINITNKLKNIKYQILCSLIILSISSSLYAAGDVESSLTPSAPPEVPAMEFSNEYGQLKINAMYSYQEIEVTNQDPIQFYTPGCLVTYTGALNSAIGYSYSLGFLYQYFEQSAESFNMCSAYIFPLTWSIAWRFNGSSESNNAMLFTGVNISYISMDLNYGDAFSSNVTMDMTINGYSYGAMAGIKGKYYLSDSLALIPYAGIQLSASSMSYSSTVTIDTPYSQTTDSGSVDADPVSSLILGFDLQIGGFSIGTMLDALSSADGNKFTINASYTFKL